MKAFVSPLISQLYLQGARIHSFLYDARILRRKRAPLPVLSIGSITSGGAGKTPFTIWLAALLNEKGHRVAILSRGFGRRGESSSRPLVVSRGRGEIVAAREGGDEPCMMASLLPDVPVIVSKNRYRAACLAYEEFQSDIALLDDGFQHRPLLRELDFVLVNVTSPFGEGLMLPQRDPKSALRKADAFILTHTDEVSPHGLSRIKKSLQKWAPAAPIFEMGYELTRIRILNDAIFHPPDPGPPPSYFAFAGIAHPESFERLLIKNGLTLVGKRWFSDHQFYSNALLREVAEAAQRVNAAALITTAKDAIKLNPAQFLHIPIYVAEGEMSLLSHENDSFYKWVRLCLEKQSAHSV